MADIDELLGLGARLEERAQATPKRPAKPAATEADDTAPAASTPRPQPR